MRQLHLLFLILLLSATPAFAQDAPAPDAPATPDDGSALAGEEQTPAEAAPDAKTEAEARADEALQKANEALQKAEEALAKLKAEAEKAARTTAPAEEAPEAKVEEKGKFRLSDHIDTKISFTFADSNLRENDEFSPSMAIGQKPESQFIGDAGEMHPVDINHTHLVLHHYSDGYIPGMLAEAALVLRFKLASDQVTGETETGVADDGTFLRLGYIFDHDGKKSMILDLTAFPFDADRFMLGFHYDLSWAGQTSFPQNADSVPGLRLGFEHPRFYVFAGVKTHLQPKKDKQNTERVPTETVYAGLFGGGVNIIDSLKFEANGGVIQKGDNPNIPEDIGGGDDDILAWGASARVSYAMGLPIGDRLDLRLYQNDPRKRLELTRHDEYVPGEFSFMISGEFTFLGQNLQDPDKTDGTSDFHAPAALLAFKMKYDYFRAHLEAAYRSLEFLLFDTPGYVPFQALPKKADAKPELYGILSVDYHIKPAYLTVGLSGGFKRPASYRGDKGSPVAVVKRRTATTAYLSPFSRAIEILPVGKDAFNIMEAKLDVEFDISDFMTFLLEVNYTHDSNQVKLATSSDDSELLYKKFEDSSITDRVGLAAILQAKF